MKITKPTTALITTAAILLTGCQSGTIRDGIHNSPTAKFLRGETDREEYYNNLKEQNQAHLDQQIIEENAAEFRAFNLETGKFEYVEKDFPFKTWNDEKKRWEFYPIREEAVDLAEKKANEDK
jgi:hypothetical protein